MAERGTTVETGTMAAGGTVAAGAAALVTGTTERGQDRLTK